MSKIGGLNRLARVTAGSAFVSSIGYVERAGRSRAALPRVPGCVPGGAYRDRTDDPLLAKQVLSQLS